MFNRSWYKNTWLGRKLGFKVNWDTEILVKKTSTADSARILHTYDKDCSCYIGFQASKQWSINRDGVVSESSSEYNILEDDGHTRLEDYNIVYDKTKIEALKRIEEIEKRIGDLTVVIRWYPDTVRDMLGNIVFVVSDEFRKLSEGLVTKIDVRERVVLLTCKRRDRELVKLICRKCV